MMNFGLQILSAAARLFGPPERENAYLDDSAFAHSVRDAGVAAALIALGAKLAKADGVVSREEVDAFKTIFQTTEKSSDDIARFFDLARQTTLGYEGYARIIAKKYKTRPDVLEDVLDGLFHIARADGIVSDDELLFLETTSRIFRFGERQFARIKAAHLGRASDDPYLILGIDEAVSDAQVKSAYRKMAGANHPDRLAARGLPAELQKLATHKMAMINKAYAEILAQRKRDRVPAKLGASLGQANKNVI